MCLDHQFSKSLSALSMVSLWHFPDAMKSFCSLVLSAQFMQRDGFSFPARPCAFQWEVGVAIQQPCDSKAQMHFAFLAILHL